MNDAQTALTPYRGALMVFDTPEFVLTEKAFACSRKGAQIALATTPGAHTNNNVELRANGAWVISPIQRSISNIHERTDTLGAIQNMAAHNVASDMKERNLFRKSSDLTGVTYDAGVMAAGDPFMEKGPTAGTSFNQSLTADIAATGQPTMPTTNVPMDRIAVSKNAHPPNQPIFLRFSVPGTGAHSMDCIKTIRFGGATLADGRGLYCASITGDGWVYLWERINTVWTLQTKWQMGDHHGFAAGVHTLEIWPHLNPFGDGGTIEFTAGTAEEATSFSDLTARYHSPAAAPRTFLWNVPFTPGDMRVNVTGQGTHAIDVRRDLKPRFQLSLHRFPVNGLVVDQPFACDFPITLRSDFTLNWTAVTPAGTSVYGRIYDAGTNVELTETGRGDNYATYTPNVLRQHYYCEFTLYSDGAGTTTPELYGFSVLRNGYIDVTRTVPYTVKGTNYSISGGEADPSHETASALIHDAGNNYPLLRVRAGGSFAIITAYDSANPLLYSVLFSGYVARPDSLKKGTTGTVYPDPEWRDVNLTCTGAWTRLHKTPVGCRFLLSSDPLSPPASPVPYKVTDVVRIFLTFAGYPYNPDDLANSMVDVPDLPIRFFGPTGGQDLIVDPLVNIAEFLIETLRRYLGAYLIWDANAGNYGKWRVIIPPQAPYQNLASFTTYSPGGALAHRPESYGSEAWVSNFGEGIETFIMRGSYRSYVKPPEGNCVIVSGTGQLSANKGGNTLLQSFMCNPAAYDFGEFPSADPTSPDYTDGTYNPITIVDPSLNTQDACDYVCRRVYDIACHGIKCAAFEAPLILVADPYDTQQAAPRPLRYYDPILINGIQFLARNCNPMWDKDEVQKMYVEAEIPNFLTV